MRSILWAPALLLWMVASVAANETKKSTRDFTVIQNAGGAARVLVKWRGSEIPDDAVILRATLRFDLGGTQEERELRVWVRSINKAWTRGQVNWTNGWARPGGDFEDSMYASTDVSLRNGTADVSVDVTLLVKRAVEAGEFADGFLVTVDPVDGEGFRPQDVSRLNGLQTATIDVQWRRFPPRRERGRG